MSIDATVIAGDQKFRIVRQVDGAKVTYLVEKAEGFDALGCERWRDVSTDAPIVRHMRDWIIRAVTKEQLADGDHS